MNVHNIARNRFLLRAIPFFLTALLLIFLSAGKFSVSADAESAVSSTTAASLTEDASSGADTAEEDSLPEYSINLSDQGSVSDCPGVVVDGSTVTITEAGIYLVSGSLSDGQIRVDTDKENQVRIVLNGVSISNDDSAAIYVLSADKLILSLQEGTENVLQTTGAFQQTDENNVDAVIFSKEDLTVKGSGTLTVLSETGHGIVSKDDLKIKNGTLRITAARKCLSANDCITVDGGVLTLNAGTEGMESTQVILNDGTVTVSAGDDGINATHVVSALTPSVEINGGSLTVVMGSGDTDGIDSNGSLSITGGTVDITSSSAFDCDGTITWTGGTVVVNGQEVSEIPNQMMGGFGAMGGFGEGAFPAGQDFGNPGGFGGGTPPDRQGFGGMGHGGPPA